MKTHTKSKQNILDNITKDQENFNQKQETGQVVGELLKNNNIDPRSLRPEYSKAREIWLKMVDFDAKMTIFGHFYQHFGYFSYKKSKNLNIGYIWGTYKGTWGTYVSSACE